MAVAPARTRFFRMLNLTINAMAIRYITIIRMFQSVRPIGMVNISASIQMPVTRRNIRSCRLIL